MRPSPWPSSCPGTVSQWRGVMPCFQQYLNLSKSGSGFAVQQENNFFSLCRINTWRLQIVQEGSEAATRLESALHLDPWPMWDSQRSKGMGGWRGVEEEPELHDDPALEGEGEEGGRAAGVAGKHSN